ncbi:hypothetical protein WN990_07940 [Kitasatospora purpeofusca]|uniref:hypothetical protein n=1 Tax=Kitasatospora purpeofusca TaxID=67352 RepID=UPI0030F0D1C4
MDQSTAVAAEGETDTRPGPAPAGPADRAVHPVVERLRALTALRWFWPAALLAGYAAQVAFRLSLSAGNYYPSVHADEDSYLVIARVLAGHPTTEMPVGVVIPGGYPLLLTPALLIADNAASAYHLIMGINGLLNALVFPLVFLVARRLGLGRGLAFAVGTAVALVPPVIFYSQFVMSDTVFPVILLCWLLAMHSWLSPGTLRRRALYAAGTGLAAGYAMATHDRGGVVVAVTAAVMLVVLAFGWVQRLASLAGLGGLAAGVGFSKALAIYVEGKFKEAPSTVGTQVIDNLTNSDLIGTTLTRFSGQLWYFMTSSWGFGAVAFVLCVVAVFGRRFELADRVVGFCMVALLCGIALASAAGLPASDNRVDNWVYARYLAPLIPIFLTVGFAALYRFAAGRLVRLAAGAAVLTLALGQVVLGYAGSDLKRYVIPWGVPDAQFLASQWDGLHMGRTTLAALLVLGACLLLRFAGGRRVVWAVTLCVALFATFATLTITDQIAQPHYKYRKWEAVGIVKDAGLKKTDNVIMDWDLDWSIRMSLPFEIYEGRVWSNNVKAGNAPQDSANAVLLRLYKDVQPEKSWPSPPAGWQLAKYDQNKEWVLWRKG